MKLLVVDNASGVESVFLRAFESHTYAFTFLFAKDSIEAIGYIRATPELSLVLLDIDEPVLDGLTLLSELPQLNPSLRVVVM
ncbi:MAG: regulator, partial [Bacteroidetes bacterium]|nr:regulator [Bacteroidota bacterium]